MSKKIRICILAPVATNHFNEMLLQAVTPVIPPDVQVEVRNIAHGSDCIQNRYDIGENTMGVVNKAREIAAEGFDGIWLSDFDMCGVEVSREVIDIPIIGGFTTSAYTALALSQRFSIITVLPSVLALQRGHTLTYGLENLFASIRSIDCPVNQLSNLDVVVAKTYKLALQAIREDGAQSILLGCTGFIGVAEKVSALLEESLGAYVPVIDPNQAGFSFLISLVRMKVRPSRLTYSKVTPG